MKIGEIIASVLEMIIKLAVLIFLVTLIYRGAQMAYDYGYRVFTEVPVSVGEGRIISVEIKENQSAMDIGEMLQQKGLIRDGKIFYLQEKLSEYRGKEVPGIYDLSTAMSGEEMLAVICAEQEAPTEEEEPISSVPDEMIVNPEDDSLEIIEESTEEDLAVTELNLIEEAGE